MPIYAHSSIDPIPDWVDVQPNEIVTHAIQIYLDTYVVHIAPRQGQGACYLCLQTLDETTGHVKWLNRRRLPEEALAFLEVILDMSDRLVHGDDVINARTSHGRV